VVGTIRLAKEGLMDPALLADAAFVAPAPFSDVEAGWLGFAARARVLIVNNRLVPVGQGPKTLAALADPRWKGKIGMAKPLFGTTATHVACLFAKLGPDKAKGLLLGLKRNDISIESGNRQVARQVAAGELAMGLTDTDDAMVEINRASDVRIVYLDTGPDEMGTLFIPNTVCAIKGGPHPLAARRLIAFLVTLDVERLLAECPSRQIPLNPAFEGDLPVKRPGEIPAMTVDFGAAADLWDKAAAFAAKHFTR
jgi:iron(III) transport system substrate-binding protein